MAAGVRSQLARWLGGASSTPSGGAAGGPRSLLARWMGGASSAPAAAGTGGPRSLLAFWMGGAGTGASPAPAPTDTGWDTSQGKAGERNYIAENLNRQYERKSRLQRDDMLAIEFVAVLLQMEMLDG